MRIPAIRYGTYSPRLDCVSYVLTSYCMAFYKAAHFPEVFYSIQLSAIALLPEASEIRARYKNSEKPYAMSFAKEKHLNALCMLYEMKKRGIIGGIIKG